ncbi:MAG TPA: imidazole glycerol phosphate synthase subunit HisH [Abditibacterium sp.]|jgi:glutamine amidotransferase
MPEVTLVDTGACNLDSIIRALEECGAHVMVASHPREIERATRLILPGVGAFGEAMATLHAAELVEPLRDRALSAHVPFLGVCLGMQLLASYGEENGPTQGLDLIEGQVVRLQPKQGERVPHVGWNEVLFVSHCPLGRGLENDKDFYFVHSFHFQIENSEYAAAQTPYCGGFVSVVGRENIWGAQFHPEKSQKSGFTLLRNFLRL